jgi:hypothetical protein
MIFRANEIVRERQATIVQALNDAGVPFALSGSNATFVWIATVDESATRQYRNVEFIIRRNDVENLVSAMNALGLTAEPNPHHILVRSMSNQRERWADRALVAGNPYGNAGGIVPSLTSAVVTRNLPALTLAALVDFQLCRWLRDDRVDLRDMIDVGLLDHAWPGHLRPELAPRLQELLDNPDG